MRRAVAPCMDMRMRGLLTPAACLPTLVLTPVALACMHACMQRGHAPPRPGVRAGTAATPTRADHAHLVVVDELVAPAWPQGGGHAVHDGAAGVDVCAHAGVGRLLVSHACERASGRGRCRSSCLLPNTHAHTHASRQRQKHPLEMSCALPWLWSVPSLSRMTWGCMPCSSGGERSGGGASR